jgi:TetR/AcrR family transcriptional repressor of nem operon
MKKTNVREQILAIAESFIQTQGYNAFSFRDIAEAVGIKTQHTLSLFYEGGAG